MKTFLALFTCAENSANHEAWKRLDQASQNQRTEKGMDALGEWFTKYKSKIIYEGGPLGDRTKLVNQQGVLDMPSQMGAFYVVEAESHQEAADMFLNHPHFSCFPGDGVAILERSEKPRGESPLT